MDAGYGLEAIHEQLLAGLILLDEICRENNIKYSLHGGTLLGAERNHHFIPWDDDADVSMTRQEYEKFRYVMLSSNRKDAFLTENVLWFSRFVYAPNQDPIFVDIFVYDFISETKIGAFCKITLLRLLQGMIKTKDTIDFAGKRLVYKILVGVSYIIGKMFRYETKLRWYYGVETKLLLGKKKRIHRSNDSFYGLPYIFDSNFMSEYKDMELENHVFMVNSRYKEFLVRNYGENYLTPPSKDKRKPEHVIIRDRLANMKCGQ